MRLWYRLLRALGIATRRDMVHMATNGYSVADHELHTRLKRLEAVERKP